MGAPAAKGYWISPDGEVYPTNDHFAFMKSHPDLFGFKNKEARGWQLADRQPVIDLALSKRWVRVRGPRPYLSFEFATLDQRTLFNIKTLLEEIGMDPKEYVNLEEVSHDAGWYRPASWIMQDEALAAARNPRRRKCSRRSTR